MNEKLCFTEHNSAFSSVNLDDLKIQAQAKSQGKATVSGVQKVAKKRVTSFIESSSPPNMNQGVKSA